MRSHIESIAGSLVRLSVAMLCIGLAAGCGEPEAAPMAPADAPVAEKPADAPKPEAVNNSPVANQWAMVMPEFVEYKSPIFITRGRPVFDSLVEFEQACGGVDPYLTPLHQRLRIDWQYMAQKTRTMEVSLLDALNAHLDTALNQAPKGGGAPAFGDDFHNDLINLHELCRKLYWDAMAENLGAARTDYRALKLMLGPLPTAQNAGARAAAPAGQAAPAAAADDSLLKGKDERYGDLAKVKIRINLRAAYAFWPAPAGVKVEYLAADPRPVTIDWSVDMANTPDFDKPQWPQPVIINTRDLRYENEYTKRINQVEVR